MNTKSARVRVRYPLLSLALALTFFSGTLFAQQAKLNPDETLKKIFASGDFSGRGPGMGGGQWVDEGAGFVRMEPSATVEKARDVVRYDTATGKKEVLVAASDLIPAGQKAPLTMEGMTWSKDKSKVLIYTNSKRVWRTNSRGDYWLLDRASKKLTKIGAGAAESTLMFAKFSPDTTKVAYVRDNNIYVEDLKSAKITQLTKDGGKSIVNGATDWVYEEEFHIADAFRWSPDGRSIAFLQFDTSGVPIFPLVYSLGVARQVVTSEPYDKVGAYPIIEEVPYPQAGCKNSAVRAGVVNVAKGKVTWLKVTGDARDNYIARIEWAGNDILMQRLNRLQNQDEFVLGNPETGAVRTVFKDEDAAWVDVNEVRMLKDGAEFMVLSDKDGWRHAYRVAKDGKLTLVTTGNIDVARIAEVDEKIGWVYFMASPENAGQRYLYRSPLDGSGAPKRLTPVDQPGTHSYQVSPDGKWAFHSYSRFDVPTMSDMIALPDHKSVKVFEDGSAMKAKIAPFAGPPVEFFQVDIGDGVKVDGWMVKPPNFDPNKKYPILFHVYGEPAGQTVLDSWSAQGWMFNRLIASEGYILASFDNRGSPAPRGREWRKAIYGKIGTIMVNDQTAAVKALLAERPYVDAKRVAVWGWSGGGSSTLNLMFRSPDVYSVGMAVAPVPDQRLYDSIYQERYMGLPQKTPETYKNGSAIEFADGLKGKLLIVHGSGDDNVHYQGSELLVNRLIELGKSFDFMTYPQRTHGISEGKGTTLHVYSLLHRFLTEHLAAGPATEVVKAPEHGE